MISIGKARTAVPFKKPTRFFEALIKGGAHPSTSSIVQRRRDARGCVAVVLRRNVGAGSECRVLALEDVEPFHEWARHRAHLVLAEAPRDVLRAIPVEPFDAQDEDTFRRGGASVPRSRRA
jgi:hypothetical protein